MRDVGEVGSTSGPPQRALRVKGTSRLAFATTTLALVLLASASTGLFVSHVTREAIGPAPTPWTAAVPSGVRPHDIVVDRAPGTWGVGWPVPMAPTVPRSFPADALPVSPLFLRGPATALGTALGTAHPGAPTLSVVSRQRPTLLIAAAPVAIAHVVTTATPDSEGQDSSPAHQNSGKNAGGCGT